MRIAPVLDSLNDVSVYANYTLDKNGRELKVKHLKRTMKALKTAVLYILYGVFRMMEV